MKRKKIKNGVKIIPIKVEYFKRLILLISEFEKKDIPRDVVILGFVLGVIASEDITEPSMCQELLTQITKDIEEVFIKAALPVVEPEPDAGIGPADLHP